MAAGKARTEERKRQAARVKRTRGENAIKPNVLETFSVFYVYGLNYPVGPEFAGVTCEKHTPEYAAKMESSGNRWDSEETTAIYSTGAENEAYCAVCGRRLDVRRRWTTEPMPPEWGGQ